MPSNSKRRWTAKPSTIPLTPLLKAEKASSPAKPAAICVAGARNGPPENSGGLDGYFRILDLLENPKARRSEEQEELLEWLGDWDPTRFVLGEINQNLGRVKVKKGGAGRGGGWVQTRIP